MSIKTKVTIGLSILVILILAQGIICNVFLDRFSKASQKILKDNYTTLEYCKEMTKALDNIHQSYVFFQFGSGDTSIKKQNPDSQKAIGMFDEYLKAEEGNITESGEKASVEALKESYQTYVRILEQAKTSSREQAHVYLTQLTFQYGQIKNDIMNIWNINMNAITRKNDEAVKASNQAVWNISIIEIITLIIIVPMLVLFPGYVAKSRKL